MTEFVPEGRVAFLKWLDDQAKTHFPEEFKKARSPVSALEIGEAMLLQASSRSWLSQRLEEAHARIGGNTGLGVNHDEFSWVDWSAYDSSIPDHYPLKPGLSREEFEGTSAVRCDPMPGESVSPLLRQVREEIECQTARKLSPKAQLDRLRDSVRLDLEKAREDVRTELRKKAFAKLRQHLFDGAFLAATIDNAGQIKPLAGHVWGGANVGAVLADGLVDGARVLVEEYSEATGPIGRILQYLKNNGQGRMLTREEVKLEVDMKGIKFTLGDLPSAYDQAVESGYIKRQVGAPTKDRQTKRRQSRSSQKST